MEGSPIEMSEDEIERTPFEDADLYEILFRDLRYDLDFYLELARAAHGPVLEVGCGTGRVLLPCLQAGVDIDGLDLYPAMLEVLKSKAASLGYSPRLYKADMRNFTLPRRYVLIIIPFNGFVHSLTTEDQLQTLRTCREHLLQDGMLVFNISFPGREVWCGPLGEPVLEIEVHHPRTGLPVRLFDTRFVNLVDQIQQSHIEIQELDAEGRVAVSHRSKTSMRFVFKPEMELLLRISGFPRWQIYGGFGRRPLTQDTDPMVVFAWKS